MSRLRVSLGEVTVTAVLNNSRTAGLVRDALPFDAEARRWGAEVYFDTSVDADAENPQVDVPSGTVAYWPPGKALCLFFGQRPYSPVNVIGTIEGDSAVLRVVRDGDVVHVRLA